MGTPDMIYVPPLRRYLLSITDGRGPMKDGTRGAFDTYVLESESLTGPWRLVSYMKKFGEQAYFAHFMSRFMSPDRRTLWMYYGANWQHRVSNPPGTGYGMNLREVRLLGPDQAKQRLPRPADPLNSPSNVALNAIVTASSHLLECRPRGAADGVIGQSGVSELDDQWVTKNEMAGAWLRLQWATPQCVDRVWLFDLPLPATQVLAGELHFGDGSKVAFGELPDDASQGREVRFPAKTVRWVEVRISRAKSGDSSTGLSEIAVFSADTNDSIPGKPK